MTLSTQQFADHIRDRWTQHNVRYIGNGTLDEMMNPIIDYSRRPVDWDSGERRTISYDQELVTEQAGLHDWGDLQPETKGPVSLVETEHGLAIYDGHHRVAAARRRGEDIEADVYRRHA